MSFQELAARYVNPGYIAQGMASLRSRQDHYTQLLAHGGRLPSTGWDEATIEGFLADLAAMDSNNFPGNSGVGEREGRVYSSLVRRRHFGLAHGKIK